MAVEKIYESPELTSTFNNASDVLVITLGVKRTDGEHITDAQKESAMNAVKSVLQIIGADVEANSTAVLSTATVAEGETLTVKTTVEILKNSGDALADIDAGVDEIEGE